MKSITPGYRVKVCSRIIIYPKDVEIITGRKHSTACRLLREIRQAAGKAKHHFVTIVEFCLYTGLKEDLVREFLQD